MFNCISVFNIFGPKKINIAQEIDKTIKLSNYLQQIHHEGIFHKLKVPIHHGCTQIDNVPLETR